MPSRAGRPQPNTRRVERSDSLTARPGRRAHRLPRQLRRVCPWSAANHGVDLGRPGRIDDAARILPRPRECLHSVGADFGHWSAEPVSGWTLCDVGTRAIGARHLCRGSNAFRPRPVLACSSIPSGGHPRDRSMCDSVPEVAGRWIQRRSRRCLDSNSQLGGCIHGWSDRPRGSSRRRRRPRAQDMGSRSRSRCRNCRGGGLDGGIR